MNFTEIISYYPVCFCKIEVANFATKMPLFCQSVYLFLGDNSRISITFEVGG